MIKRLSRVSWYAQEAFSPDDIDSPLNGVLFFDEGDKFAVVNSDQDDYW